MAFDAARNVSVAVAYGVGSLQVWERAAGSWSLRGTSPSTGLATNHSVAFDTGRSVSVIAIGGNGDGGGGDLAEWGGAVWNSTAPPVLPPTRTRQAIACDAARGVTVLFGGAAAQSGTLIVRQDTWTWDGTLWTQRFPFSFPTIRAGHAMAYDSVRQRVVLFGGTTAGLLDTANRPPEFFYGDTWEWDGTAWVERTPQGTTPVARHEHALAYDPVARVTYLFGGLDASGIPLNDLWTWDGSRWTQLATQNPPGRRFDCAMAFDATRGKLVVFGGQNALWSQYRQNWSSWPCLRDTWEYTPGVAGSFDTFGTGCSGIRGTPALRLQGTLPTAGQTLRVQLDNLPLVGPAFVFLGASNTTYGALPLPFPLASIGMTGCTLYVSGDALLQVQNVLGTALFTADLPFSTVGGTLYMQALPFDLSANTLGLTASHGAQIRVGG